LAASGGNDPHSLAVTVLRASMNTLRPIFIVKHRECQFRSPALTVPKPMQLFQDQSPAALTRIVYTSAHDTLITLNYKKQIVRI
jgi:hypothetical protein